MAECSFCGEKLKPGTGFLFVKKDGTGLLFCSRKCEKNLLQLKRKPAATKWTRVSRLAKEAAKPGKKKAEKKEVEKEKKEGKKKARKKRKPRRKQQ